MIATNGERDIAPLLLEEFAERRDGYSDIGVQIQELGRIGHTMPIPTHAHLHGADCNHLCPGKSLRQKMLGLSAASRMKAFSIDVECVGPADRHTASIRPERWHRASPAQDGIGQQPGDPIRLSDQHSRAAQVEDDVMAPFIERDMTILIDVTDRRPSEGLFIKVHRGSALIRNASLINAGFMLMTSQEMHTAIKLDIGPSDPTDPLPPWLLGHVKAKFRRDPL